MAELGEFSRFNKTPEVIIEGNETFGVWTSPSWLKNKPKDSQIGVFRVVNQFEGRPDRISNQIYGTTKLAWVLISFNAMHNNDRLARNGFGWPRAGQTILYPLDSIVFPEVA